MVWPPAITPVLFTSLWMMYLSSLQRILPCTKNLLCGICGKSDRGTRSHKTGTRSGCLASIRRTSSSIPGAFLCSAVHTGCGGGAASTSGVCSFASLCSGDGSLGTGALGGGTNTTDPGEASGFAACTGCACNGCTELASSDCEGGCEGPGCASRACASHGGSDAASGAQTAAPAGGSAAVPTGARGTRREEDGNVSSPATAEAASATCGSVQGSNASSCAQRDASSGSAATVAGSAHRAGSVTDVGSAAAACGVAGVSF
mmetsp:Transcript_66527/g.154591  ORF Transcript_66527/g.154591 Transcript_66527/m.154591 type:complete len:260 (+) Transcript_66527:219-998(+)